MKVFKVTNNFLTNQINKRAGDWDDIISIPDIADNFTDDKYEKYNPLCYDFWFYKIQNNNYESSFHNHIKNVAEIYKKYSK